MARFMPMKPILILLFAMLALEGRLIAGLDTDIPQTNRAILGSGRWTPLPEDTQKALVAVQAFLANPGSTNNWEKREIWRILQHTKEYRVQFVGVVRDGKRFIWCNFFPSRGNYENWKKDKVDVMDGGFWYWQIDYDPSTDTCLNFYSNAYG
jgi:hypothetical protein